jgi:hypothetical protein
MVTASDEGTHRSADQPSQDQPQRPPLDLLRVRKKLQERHENDKGSSEFGKELEVILSHPSKMEGLYVANISINSVRPRNVRPPEETRLLTGRARVRIRYPPSRSRFAMGPGSSHRGPDGDRQRRGDRRAAPSSPSSCPLPNRPSHQEKGAAQFSRAATSSGESPVSSATRAGDMPR